MIILKPDKKCKILPFFSLFSGKPKCELQVLILLCTPEKDSYLGFIPNDQVIQWGFRKWHQTVFVPTVQCDVVKVY